MVSDVTEFEYLDFLNHWIFMSNLVPGKFKGGEYLKAIERVVTSNIELIRRTWLIRNVDLYF